MKRPKPIVLMIRDGWGHRREEELNAPKKGDVPFTRELMENYPNVLINAAGEAVGLPEGYQGNSEVGHMTIGSGRIIYQSMVRINKEIESGEFFDKKPFLDAIENCRKNKTNLHLIGLLQQEGVHAHINHLLALLDLCRKEDFKDVYVHVVSDGRDAPPKNTINNLKILLEKFKEIGFGTVASISGRYYAMDRDKRWDRTKKAYDCIVNAVSKEDFKDPLKQFEESYEKGETDEFIIPKKWDGYEGIKENDSLIFYNFRTDRPRQLSRAMIDPKFEPWGRDPLDICFVAMTQYYNPMPHCAQVAYPPEDLSNLLGKVLADAGLRQLRISETEKYAHVTFFFNGQKEEANEGEDRKLIPSPKVATYEMKPEMSVKRIADGIIEAVDADKYDVIITNFVNGDMVGHTGSWEAVLKAVKVVDENIKRVTEKVLLKGGALMIFADHGNCEDMTPDWATSHTANPVPFILVSEDPELKSVQLKKGKGLSDIAPTLLKLLGVAKPGEMTGEALF